MPSICDCPSCENQRRLSNGDHLICRDCGGEYDIDLTDHMSDEYCDRCWEDEYGDTYVDDDEGDGQYVHSYSYRPSLNFHSADDNDDSELFFGFELEVGTDYESDMAQRIATGPGDHENLLYCKQDGSIDGVEIVSHPMTFDFFRRHFPAAQMFDPNGEATRLLRRREQSSGYGLHIHVSRAGFKSEMHTLRWLLFIYKSREQVQALARRTENEWTSFRDEEACEQKAKGVGGASRYVAVNGWNESTLEMRMFRSTWNEQEFKAAIQFAHASVIFARDVSTKATMRDGLSWDKFVEFLQGKDEYAELRAEIARQIDAAEAA